MRQLLVLSLVLAAAAPAVAARGFTVGAPYANLRDTPYTDAEDAKAMAGLKPASGVRVSATELVHVDGKPVRKIVITPSARTTARAKTAPIHVGISAGVHRDEAEALRVADRLMIDAAAGRAGNVKYTFYRPVNASPQEGRLRHTRQGTDLNRTFSNKNRTPEMRPVRDALRADATEMDLFLDLHGGKQDGFFVIGKDKDDPLIARAMRALPKWLVVSEYGNNLKKVPLTTPGMKSSKNYGTLRMFVQGRGVPSYTVEYPRRAEPRRQNQGMRRLVDSVISHKAKEIAGQARVRSR